MPLGQREYAPTSKRLGHGLRFVWICMSLTEGPRYVARSRLSTYDLAIDEREPECNIGRTARS